MFLYDDRNRVDGLTEQQCAKDRHYAVQNYVDIASTFHQAGSKLLMEGSSWNCQDTRDSFDQVWITPYGPPEFCLMDDGWWPGARGTRVC